MADDKKNISDVAPPTEAPAPTVEVTAAPEPPAPEPVLTDAEAVMLEQEGHAALFEMGDAVPDPADAVTHAEVEEPAAPEVPKAEKEQAQPPAPGKDDPAPAHSGKVVDFSAARDEAAKEEKKAIKQKPPKEKGKATKPGKGRPPKAEKVAPEQGKPPKAGKTHAAPEEKAAPPAPEVPTTPRDATRTEKEEIVYLDLSDLHPFKDHPFGVRDDAEMKSLVESVRNSGVNQPALVRPREGGGYEIIAGHRRQMASQLAGYRNMPCIVRNMTDDEARAVLSAFTAADISMPASGRWAGAGMVRGHTPDLAWRLMDAQHWASPRLARRQRVFVVADFGGQCSHEILFKPRTVQSISASGGDCWLSAACGDRGSFIEAGRRVPITRPFQCYRMRASAKERTTEAFRNSFGLPTDPFPTLLASTVSPFAFWYEDDPAGGCVRFPTERECERLMGLPEGWTKYGADGEEILPAHRYRAAKATMAELLGGEKLPKMDVLKEKRRQLAARKKALYLEYRKAQQDMRELVAVKGSVDHLRGLTDSQRNKEQAR